MAILSINPATGEVLQNFEEIKDSVIEEKLELAEQAFQSWRRKKLADRSKLFSKLSNLYLERKEELAKLATLEMGKTLKEAIAEVEKCAWTLQHYADNTENYLQEIKIDAGFTESFVQFDPLGVVLAVMPWNFPYWQAIRAFAPIVMAGNTMVLKHASNVPQVALKMEELALEAGFPKGIFQTLLIGSSKVEQIINDDRIKAVTLTGSEYAGSKVAEAAGRNIKPSVLELGGSDPFIVMADADIDIAVKNAASARTLNNGQSCIAAKRFIVHESIYDEFVSKLKNTFEGFMVGDPMNSNTHIGPLANEQGLKDIEVQVNDAKKSGANIVCGGERLNKPGYFYSPTIIDEITPEMELYTTEVFGPVASVYKFSEVPEAVEIANATTFGLGASIWTKDIQAAKMLAKDIDAGSVFINQVVRSHPYLPFGGIKKSGYGRELGEFGIKEFVNIKTVVVG